MLPPPTLGGKKPGPVPENVGLRGGWGRWGTWGLMGTLGLGGTLFRGSEERDEREGLCWEGGRGAVRVPSLTILLTGGGELRANVH